MYHKPTLSLDQVQKAMAAMVEHATQKPDQPVAIAIVDDVGNLLSYARMDRCRVIPQRLAIRKAYTSALSGQDSRAYAERLKSQGRSVAEMGDPNLAAVQGGGVVLHPVVYLSPADKSHRLTRRLSQGQKGLDERALMASQRPSEPW